MVRSPSEGPAEERGMYCFTANFRTGGFTADVVPPAYSRRYEAGIVCSITSKPDILLVLTTGQRPKTSRVSTCDTSGEL
jgi:hypothetical protein